MLALLGRERPTSRSIPECLRPQVWPQVALKPVLALLLLPKPVALWSFVHFILFKQHLLSLLSPGVLSLRVLLVYECPPLLMIVPDEAPTSKSLV